MSLTVRKAIATEIDWINTCYQEVGFVQSDIKTEYIAIAELEGQKCGLGRLTRIDDSHVELGGMYVLDNYQGQGVAGAIIKHLLEQTNRQENIWCLPFKNLLKFYSRFGFEPYTPNFGSIPGKIAEKHRWCNETYDTEVLLLVKSNS